MASVSWTATTGGTWSTGSNWSTGAAPLRGDDVTINANSSTVSYTVGSLFIDSLTTVSTNFAMSGGVLAVENGYNISGGLTVSGGTLHLVNGAYGNDTITGSITQSAGALILEGGATAQGSTLTQSGGSIVIGQGIFADGEASTAIAGTIGGGGEMIFDGATYFDTGLVLNVAVTEIGYNTTVLNTSIKDGQTFDVGAYGTLSLNSNVMTISGKAVLDGQITNGGTLVASGVGSMDGLLLNNGSSLDISGTLNQTGNIALAQTGSGSLTIMSTGTLRLAGNVYVENGGSGAIMTNDGLLTKIGGGSLGGVAAIETQFFNMGTGTINAAVGTIEFAGPNSPVYNSLIGGSMSGAGTISFATGYYSLTNINTTSTTVSHLLFTDSVNVTLSAPAGLITYGGDWDQNGGLLLVENNLTLSGDNTFDGGELKGTATIDLSTFSMLHLGGGMDLEGNLTFMLNGPVVQTGGINLGYLSDSVDQANLASGEVWALEGAASISGGFGTITDLGVFAKLDGAQDSVVQSKFTDVSTNAGGTVTASGTVLVNAGTLALTGNGTLGGSVGGSAVLDIGGAFTLASGLLLTVGEFIVDTNALVSLSSTLSYAKEWASEGGTLALTGGALTLAGQTSLLYGGISGTGTVTVSGTAVIGTANGSAFQLAQGADLVISGAADQAGDLLLTAGATAPQVTIAATGTYSMEPALNSGDLAYIGAAQGSPVGTLTVDGALRASTFGVTQINATLNNNGSITESGGTMQFLGAVQGSGSFVMTNGGTMQIVTGSMFNSAITFGAGGGLLYLENTSDFFGAINGFAAGDGIELNNFYYADALAAPVISNHGLDVTIADGVTRESLTLTFSTAQSAASLLLGSGPDGYATLFHT